MRVTDSPCVFIHRRSIFHCLFHFIWDGKVCHFQFHVLSAMIEIKQLQVIGFLTHACLLNINDNLHWMKTNSGFIMEERRRNVFPWNYEAEHFNTCFVLGNLWAIINWYSVLFWFRAVAHFSKIDVYHFIRHKKKRNERKLLLFGEEGVLLSLLYEFLYELHICLLTAYCQSRLETWVTAKNAVFILRTENVHEM